MAALPVGTVTFLFTDIEGSTRRWEKHPAAMKAAIERHDALLKAAIEARGGQVFKTVGDAVYAAFPTAPGAILAAIEGQQAIQREQWNPEIAPLKVRMALHTGIGEAYGNDYVGQPLNRVARLLSTGYGGQILISHPTYDLVYDALPAEVSLRDLGEHRLKDLTYPEHIFQLLAPGLQGDFPALRTLENRPNNLPSQPTPLVGRESELEAVSTLLRQPDVRLITLTGAGGTGKTRLGLQVAADMLDEYADGVFFVPLVSIRNAGLVAPSIMQALGVRESGEDPTVETLKDYLKSRQALLLLDNFEQVLAAAPIVAELLAAAPALKILVTSRETLHLRGEKEFAVPPLSLPDPRNIPSVEQLSQFGAIALFVQRAQDVKPDFAVTTQNAQAIAEICRRLDGLPLAIELAAARIKFLPPQAMLARLQSRLRLLTSGARDLPDRQQTLRNTIGWSYDLLTPAEQLLFKRLAVFAGGSTLEAVEAVCDAEGDLEVDTLEGLSTLTDKSLIRNGEGSNGEPRFRMLETIREFAMEKLEVSGEVEEMLRRHTDFYLTTAKESDNSVLGEWWYNDFDLIEDEHDNMRAVLRRTSQDPNLVQVALEMSAALCWFWDFRDYFSEGQAWLETILALPAADTHNSARANALRASGTLSMLQGDYTTARSRLLEGLEMARQVGDERCVALALPFLCFTFQLRGEYVEAIKYGEEGVALLRKLGDLSFLGLGLFALGDAFMWAGDYEKAKSIHKESSSIFKADKAMAARTLPMISLGRIAMLQGDYATARSLLEESIAIRRKQKNRWLLAISITTLGDLALYESSYDEAEALAQESLDIYRAVGDNGGIAWAVYNLGWIALHESDYKRASEMFKEGLMIRNKQGNKMHIALNLLGFASLASAKGQYERTVRLLGAMNALLAEDGVRLDIRDQDEYEHIHKEARSQMNQADWSRGWNEGQALNIEQAVEYALSEDALASKIA